MRDYAKMAEAFRHCAEGGLCADCPMYDNCPDIDGRKNAADAIEELLAESADLVGQVKRPQEEIRKLDKKIAKLKSSVPKWISVGERLPGDDRAFLVSIHDDSGDGAFDYTDVGWTWIGENGDRLFVVDNQPCSFVTHWMPLPEPPKEDAE